MPMRSSCRKKPLLSELLLGGTRPVIPCTLPRGRISGSIVRRKDEQEILLAYAQSLLLVDWMATPYGQD